MPQARPYDRDVPEQPHQELVRRAISAAALGVAAAVSARAYLRSGSATKRDRKLIDWEAVRRVAVQRSGEAEPAPPLRDAERLGEEYARIAQELAPLPQPLCGDVLTDLPRFAALDRRGFIDTNLVIVRRLLEPVEQLRATLPEHSGAMFARRFLDRYIGELFGLMSRRVLGQYDPVLTLGTAEAKTGDQPALYLMEPNIAAFERDHRLPGDALRHWLILHELTHAWQFQTHAWLRDYITGQMREMLLSPIATPDGSSLLRSRDIMQRLPETVRTQLRSVSRLQAVMSVLEGYSNFVMHRVGRQHIEHADALEAAARHRRSERSVLERLVFALTGLEMKMRQYEVGERFADYVVERSDIATLNRVWQRAEALPSMEELRHPARWLARMG
jgi:coenzyme F420 biosynthesis associated uncharacterized protein